MGYNATLYNNGDKENIQHILDRCWGCTGTSARLSVESPAAGLLLRRSFRRGVKGSSGYHRYMAGQRVVGRGAYEVMERLKD